MRIATASCLLAVLHCSCYMVAAHEQHDHAQLEPAANPSMAPAPAPASHFSTGHVHFHGEPRLHLNEVGRWAASLDATGD